MGSMGKCGKYGDQYQLIRDLTVPMTRQSNLGYSLFRFQHRICNTQLQMISNVVGGHILEKDYLDASSAVLAATFFA